MRQVTRLYQISVVLVIIMWLSLVPAPAQAVPASYDWGSFDPGGNTTHGVYGVDNFTVLPTGSLVQFIWTGPNRTIDSPLPNGSPGGDDQLLDSNRVNNGLPLPPPQHNKGYIPLKTYTFDSENSFSDGLVYIRAWNFANAALVNSYGDSTTETLSSGGVMNATRWFTDQRIESYEVYLPTVIYTN